MALLEDGGIMGEWDRGRLGWETHVDVHLVLLMGIHDGCRRDDVGEGEMQV